MNITMRTRHLYWGIALALSLVTITPASAAEIYPNRPIKIVVPVAAGGAPDVVARFVAENLTEKLGQPVVVENRPGAGERIGAEYVAKADPDGYTLLAAPPGTLVISPLLYRHLGFDPTAFVPVTLLTTSHIVLVARSTIEAASLQELIDFARQHPGKLTYASPGVGTPPHLTGEMLKAAAHIEVTHVPYKGLAPAVTDLLAGHVDFMFDNIGNSLSHIREGQLKAFGVASAERIPELPGVPAIVEAFPGVRSTSWFAVAAPPKTPAVIAETLSHAIAGALHRPDVVTKLRAMGLTPVGSSPGELAAFLKEESDRWRAVITAADIHPE